MRTRCSRAGSSLLVGGAHAVLTGLAVLGPTIGCQGEISRWCDAYGERFASCMQGVSPKLRASIAKQCRVIRGYEPAPSDAPGNLAALAKRALEACSPDASCSDFKACLQRSGCELRVRRPDAVEEAQLWCQPP